MARVGRLTSFVLSASRSLASSSSAQHAVEGFSPARLLAASQALSRSFYHTSRNAWAVAPTTTGTVTKTDDALAHLADKDVWDEAWAYEPRFGTEENPIVVPALMGERIIGVTDPDDDTLVIWGIIREGEPPKQLVLGGEFFVLKRVDKIEKVGDKLGIGVE